MTSPRAADPHIPPRNSSRSRQHLENHREQHQRDDHAKATPVYFAMTEKIPTPGSIPVTYLVAASNPALTIERHQQGQNQSPPPSANDIIRMRINSIRLWPGFALDLPNRVEHAVLQFSMKSPVAVRINVTMAMALARSPLLPSILGRHRRLHAGFRAFLPIKPAHF